LLRRAHDHHRDLRTRRPAAAVAHPVHRHRQLMTVASLSPSPITASVRCRYITGTGHPPPMPTLSATFARENQSIKHQITVSIASGAAKTSTRPVIQPSSLFGTDKSDQAPAANPHRPTVASVRTPAAVSSLEAFRTPASVRPHTPVTGRRPKTLNESGRQAGWPSAPFCTGIAAPGLTIVRRSRAARETIKSWSRWRSACGCR
jgi:hypothetical protein